MQKKSVAKFVIIDRNQIYKKGLISILRSSEIVGEVHEYPGLNHLNGSNDETILLIEHDLIFESEDSKSLIFELRSRPSVKVVSLADNAEDVDLPSSLELGICGVLVRNMLTEELISAVKIIQNGECYVAHEVSKRYLTEICSASGKRKRHRSKPLLTNRETQVLKMICEDLTNHEIANKLFISPRTVDGHRSNILQKLGIRSKAGLVRFALENNMLSGSN